MKTYISKICSCFIFILLIFFSNNIKAQVILPPFPGSLNMSFIYSQDYNLYERLMTYYLRYNVQGITGVSLSIGGKIINLGNGSKVTSFSISDYIPLSLFNDKQIIHGELHVDMRCYNNGGREQDPRGNTGREEPGEWDPEMGEHGRGEPGGDPYIGGPVQEEYSFRSERLSIEIFNNNVRIEKLPKLQYDGQSIKLTQGHPKGGRYVGKGVQDGVFYPQIAGVGVHEIKYICDYGLKEYYAVSSIQVAEMVDKPVILSDNENYIATTTYINKSKNTYTDVEYFDGFGKSIQKISIGASPLGGDIIESKDYNEFGLESKLYLPYVSKTSSGSFDRSYKINQSNYYRNNTDKSIANSNSAFRETFYEKSDLHRVVEASCEGENWSKSSKHTKKFKYSHNVSNEVVNFSISSGNIINNGYFKAGDLEVNQFYNENWKSGDGNINTTKEYKDYEGRTILKRSYILNSKGKEEILSTYYVYDVYGDLIYVLPPEMKVGTREINKYYLNKYSFHYIYDNQHRLMSKKLPGIPEVYMVYDKFDRLVLRQDGNQRNNGNKVPEWTYYKYDEYNRIIEQGKCTSDLSAEHLIDRLDKFPNHLPSDTEAEVYHYYDDYSFINNSKYSFQDIRKIKKGSLSYNRQVKGQLTGSKSKVIGLTGDYWITSVNYYDSKYRIIEEIKDNYPSGKHVLLNEYDFMGKIVKSYMQETNFNKTSTIENSYSYDRRGRLLSEQQSINGGPFISISKSIYNELGMESSKLLGKTNSIDYLYNIRGWVKELKSNVFDISLSYASKSSGLGNMPFTSQYTGNISAIEWKYKSSKLSGVSKVYTYSYDGISRLKSALYGESGVKNDKYNVSLSYDLNGNIQTLKRKNNSKLIDDLAYRYSGNLLLSVLDKGDSSLGFKDGYKGDYEYSYDSNGNMISDKNKYISKIEYNSLNLPKEISMQNKRIRYVYSSDGDKLQNILPSKTLTYSNGFVYENGSLSYILTNVGRYVINGSSGKYEYNLCDHLGNVRAVVDDSGELLQQNDYYPFGGVMSSFGGSDNKYLYNGKELQEGTDWLDYGARMYDANLGRFFNKDRFADNYYDLSIYQYAGNNPIKCIDVNGDYIFIIGEDNKRYKYEDGKLYSKNEAGRWIEYKAKEGSYLAIILRHLNILASKKNGKELIDFFMGNTNSVNIRQREKGRKGEGNKQGGWTVRTERKPKGGIIPTEKGLRRSPLYVALAHEMAHRQDALNGNFSEKMWFITDDGDVVIEAEKYSTHIENIIRAEHGLPLRTHYARDENEGVGPEIINDGKSCFYKKDGTDYNYRYTPPKKKKSNEKKQIKNHKK